MSQKTATKKTLEALKEVKELAESGVLKKLKKKEEVDSEETFGGKRIKKKGPPIIAPKRKDDVGVGGYQEPLEDKYPPRKFAGGGRATHGYGKAYMKGGRVK